MDIEKNSSMTKIPQSEFILNIKWHLQRLIMSSILFQKMLNN